MNPGAVKSAEIRSARARLKLNIHAGHQPIGLTLMRPCSAAERMEVGDLLRAVRGIARPKLNRICRRADVLPTELLCELSTEARRRLVLALPPHVFGGREHAPLPITVSVTQEKGATPPKTTRPRTQR